MGNRPTVYPWRRWVANSGFIFFRFNLPGHVTCLPEGTTSLDTLISRTENIVMEAIVCGLADTRGTANAQTLDPLTGLRPTRADVPRRRWFHTSRMGAALIALLCLISAVSSAAAQGQEKDPWAIPAIKLNLNEDGSQYLRFILWSQFWARATELNPGTTVAGSDNDFIGDIAIRRSRFLMFGKLDDRILIMMHMGINNQTVVGARKPQVYVHDAWGQFDLFGPYLSVGAGIHYWNGVSRMTNSSTFKYLSIDAPITNWPAIEKTDQFARQMGIFAKGQIGRLDYRVALNQPFAVSDNLENAFNNIGFQSKPQHIAYAGYFQYMFGDIEGNLLPYTAGTYLGTKSVFNIGAGFHYHGDALAQQVGDDIEEHDMLLLGLDLFVDQPLGGGAFTGYLAYYNFDFGPNYVRNVGIANLADAGSGNTFNGGGNAYPIIGTGQHIYAQAGYLLPGWVGTTRLQPYAAIQFSDMEGLADPAITPEFGLNWLIRGQNAKVTFHYRLRPIFVEDGNDIVADSSASEFITQLQIMM